MNEKITFKTVWLALNYSCNNQCIWCYASSDDTGNYSKIMDLNLAKQSLNLCSDLGIKSVILIGGEPTLYHNLEELIQHAKEKDFFVSMVTNGRKLRDKEFLRKLTSTGLDNVTLSLESPNGETHDTITQARDSHSETISGLENCLSEGIDTTTETTISQINKHEMEEMVRFLTGMGLKRIMFNLCSPSIHRADYSQSISPREGAKIIEKLYLLGKSFGVDVYSVTPLPICNLSPEVAKEMTERRLLNASCHIFYGTNFVIDYNGDVLPCVHFSGFPIMSVYKPDRTIKTPDEFKEEYTKEEGIPAQFRRALWKYPTRKCQEDPYFGKCTGGCTIFWLKQYSPDKEINGISPAIS